MPLPPWTVELLRRSIADVAKKASEPETLEKIKKQATEILQDLPQTAARSIDAVMRTAEAGKRSVQEWSQRQTAVAVPMLNASGILLHEKGSGVRISQVAIDAGTTLLSGGNIANGETQSHIQRRIEKVIPADGDYSIAVANSFESAMTAFSQFVQKRPLVIHRSHAVRLPDGTPLPDAFGSLMPVVQEVGSVGSVSPEDYDGLESFCAIVADDGQEPLELQDFGDRDAMQSVVLPVATFLSNVWPQVPSVESMITAGADAVILPGSGICGGPECGLVVARREIINAIDSSPAWPSLKANDAIQVMMAVSLELQAATPDESPVRALLNTNVENLQSRAARMSTRCAASEHIASCETTNDDATLTASSRWAIPSCQLRLKHKSLKPADWANELEQGVPAVVVATDDQSIIVDLRWMDPANDNALAIALTGEPTENHSSAETTA